ncbi:MAG: DMT family transporter [Lachnospiraceae bacterium]|nr:DMT family transporter [Lachnospiraceae bacterium]
MRDEKMNNMPMKKNYIFAITTVFMWSTLAAVVKLLLSDIPNLQALAISSYISSGFLLIVNVFTGKIKVMKSLKIKDIGIISGLGFIGLFVYSALYYYGLSQLTSQEACIVNYLWPIMLVIFSCIILKEKLTAMKAVAMICSFVGIVVLSMGSGDNSEGNVTLGIFSCIIAAACYGLFSVLNKKFNYDQSISMMIFWLVAAVCSTVLGIVTEDWVSLDGRQWLGMLWLGIVVDAIAYLLWAIALNGTGNTAKIANIAYLTPFLSLVVSALLLKEEITLRALVALVFIIGGILLQSLYDQRRKDKVN